MIIGIDLHGTITPHGFYNPNMKLPWWLFSFLVPLILLSKPDKALVAKMQMMEAQGNQFMILTCAPDQFSRFTKRLLIFHRVPFVNLLCVGFGEGSNERKLKVIREKKIKIFIDNDRRTIAFMRKNLVNAVNTSELLN